MGGEVRVDPYSYPAFAHQRKHGPAGWKTYRRYRPWLRDEFVFRCVYCLEREKWRDMREKMHLDHFEAQTHRPDLKCEYRNLLYLCPACNHLKRDSILPDPCAVNLGDCLRIFDDGRIKALQDEGQELIDFLELDGPLARKRRRIIIGMIRTLQKHHRELFVKWMGFPEDLPNLKSKPNRPPQNTKPEGVEDSFFALRERGELPAVY